MKLALLLVPSAAFAPIARPRLTPPPAAVVDDIKTQVIPDNTDSTVANAVGWQSVGWGVGGLLFPTQMMSTLFGAAVSGGNLALLRGLSVTNLVLGNQIIRGGDAKAAQSGFLFFAVWTKILKHGLNAGTLAGYTSSIIAWNTIMAVITARRQGGLYKTITSLDTDSLSSVLPSGDIDLSTKNVVGLQLTAWGVIATFFPSFLFGSMMLGMKADGVANIMASGLGLGNLLLGGKVLAGSDKDAAATGAVVLGAWAVIGWLGKAAGHFTGTYSASTAVWNALVAAYCVKKLTE